MIFAMHLHYAHLDTSHQSNRSKCVSLKIKFIFLFVHNYYNLFCVLISSEAFAMFHQIYFISLSKSKEFSLNNNNLRLLVIRLLNEMFISLVNMIPTLEILKKYFSAPKLRRKRKTNFFTHKFLQFIA